MTEELSPNLDHEPNGRCRAYWTAYSHSPGHKNPFTWAADNFVKFLEESIKLDRQEGMLSCCKSHKKTVLKPIRTRKRRRRHGT